MNMRQFMASCLSAVKRPALTAAIIGAALAIAAPARAEECPGHPGAIGTSRVLTLEPGTLTRVGKMQYPDTLPLADHEVVLTFDDGPLPPYTKQILEILASQCVKATFFMVGTMARNFPDVVRRVHAAGHTIGTHSENHPMRFGSLPIERMRSEIDDGIADVGAALGDPSELAPFFRIPGLARSDTLEAELAARSLVVFSVDAVADDWHHRIKPKQIVARAMQGLEAHHGGILLLHDIHAVTVAALPDLLDELHDNGFHIVQVVPGGANKAVMSASASGEVTWTAAQQDALDDTNAAVDWPRTDVLSTAASATEQAPDLQSFHVADVPGSVTDNEGFGSEGSERDAFATAGTATPGVTPSSSEPQLPAPSLTDIGLPVTPPKTIAARAKPTMVSEVGTPDSPPAEHLHIRHENYHEGYHGRRHARVSSWSRQHAGAFRTFSAASVHEGWRQSRTF